MRGRSCKTYMDTDSDWSNPTWLEITRIIDETITPSIELASGGSRAEEYTQNEVGSRSFEWTATYRYDKCDDTTYAALLAAFVAGDPVFMLFLDGAVTTVGSRGWKAPILISTMPQARNLGDLVEVTVTGVGKLHVEDNCTIRKPEPYLVEAGTATTVESGTTTTSGT